MIYITKRAFTLVELIVVITILAVLATVGFISMTGYSQKSRDSVRLSDIKSIEKILELYNVKNDKYPNPDNYSTITYSGANAWLQGVFGTSAYTNSASMSDIPVDPVLGLKYPYSITPNGQEYQLAGILEAPTSMKVFSPSFANTQEANILVKGNYNGQFLKVHTGSTTYILGVPSIFTSDTSDITLESILSNQKLVYNGFKNLPASFSGSKYNTNPNGGFNFISNQEILFQGNIQTLNSDPTQRILFLNNLQQYYSGSILEDKSNISDLLKVDTSNGDYANNYISGILNKTLKSNIIINSTNTSLVVPKTLIGDDSTGRNWSDGTYATSCLSYLPEGNGIDGVYWIEPTGFSAFKVYCDMNSDGGGWTLISKFSGSDEGNSYFSDTGFNFSAITNPNTNSSSFVGNNIVQSLINGNTSSTLRAKSSSYDTVLQRTDNLVYFSDYLSPGDTQRCKQIGAENWYDYTMSSTGCHVFTESGENKAGTWLQGCYYVGYGGNPSGNICGNGISFTNGNNHNLQSIDGGYTGYPTNPGIWYVR